MYYFFVFKQKTAYEMRISDWSSDVCSSDLRGDQQRVTADAHGHAAGDRGLAALLQAGVVGHGWAPVSRPDCGRVRGRCRARLPAPLGPDSRKPASQRWALSLASAATWIVEAPYVMQAANDLRFHLGWAAQVCNAAKALPNLLNPFWILPLLGWPGLPAGAPLGFTLLQLSGAYPAGSGVAVGAGV